jgi:hypothetical protein
VVDLVRDDLRAALGAAEAVVQFVTGGLFGLGMLCAAGKLALSVEKVDVLFRRLAIPGVKAVPDARGFLADEVQASGPVSRMSLEAIH